MRMKSRITCTRITGSHRLYARLRNRKALIRRCLLNKVRKPSRPSMIRRLDSKKLMTHLPTWLMTRLSDYPKNTVLYLWMTRFLILPPIRLISYRSRMRGTWGILLIVPHLHPPEPSVLRTRSRIYLVRRVCMARVHGQIVVANLCRHHQHRQSTRMTWICRQCTSRVQVHRFLRRQRVKEEARLAGVWAEPPKL